MTKLGTDDYPLAERRPEIVTGRRGKPLDALTIEAVLSGEVTMEDLRITPQALRQQAEIARAAGRPTLAANFERAAELADIPQEVVMRIYELLRPGRARSRAELEAAAAMLRRDHAAPLIAAFVEEAADVYERRGLFAARY
ncbi:propanediol dehydratase small subunit [Tepidamorphus gemmatus]|uniref:Propanediol dehydratase small subunit n=1 Tax=Tepidamorphus gemmatus TaxID=747076 RepID=A0A4R3MBN7_9HYPH|nr:diol dehydratase small subunit [Tepidamorphus gemmatus]TCT10766.1 propanediol dehydratase small subunit [Tepidamorphus gemmatus]